MKTFVISNRQSGKTKLATYEFMKNPENSIFIGYNEVSVEKLPFYEKYRKNVFTTYNANQFIKGHKIDNVILDEYLCFGINIRKELYNLLPTYIKNYFIFSSPNKLYDLELFNYVKEAKSKNIPLSELSIKNYTVEDVEDLYYNYLTDKDTTIIHDKYFFNPHKPIKNECYLSDTSYQCEIEGKYLSN
jgi:hypothetical protein